MHGSSAALVRLKHTFLRMVRWTQSGKKKAGMCGVPVCGDPRQKRRVPPRRGGGTPSARRRPLTVSPSSDTMKSEISKRPFSAALLSGLCRIESASSRSGARIRAGALAFATQRNISPEAAGSSIFRGGNGGANCGESHCVAKSPRLWLPGSGRSQPCRTMPPVGYSAHQIARLRACADAGLIAIAIRKGPAAPTGLGG